MQARKPLPSVDECLIASATLAAATKGRLARMKRALDTMGCYIESSAEALEASQALLAELQGDENSKLKRYTKFD
jgi:hypothetical protein